MLIKTDQDTLQSYFEDASGLRGGHAGAVVIPETDEELAAYLKQCSLKGTKVTISGGGTGVTGGRVPFGGELLSLEKFTALSPVDKLSGHTAMITVGAGVRIADLKKLVRADGWLYPPDPTEQLSTIGGNIATNASGSRGYRYGSTRAYVQSVRGVTAEGRLISLSRGECLADKSGTLIVPTDSTFLNFKIPSYTTDIHKNAAGYFSRPQMDAVDLFIGSEGTLAAITSATVLLIPDTEGIIGGIAFIPRSTDALALVRRIRAANRESGIRPLSLEYFDRNALSLLRDDYPAIPQDAAAAIFFEQDVSQARRDSVVSSWADQFESFGVPSENVWFADQEKDEQAFRDLRHRLPEKVNEIVRRNGYPKTGTDLAVSENAFAEMMAYYDTVLGASGMQYLVFGHIGEFHMHANLLPSNEAEYVRAKQIYLDLARKAVSLGGTVSAEHGIGKLKHPFLELMLGGAGIAEMARVKRVFDPALILNRGNIIPESLFSGKKDTR